MYPVKYAGTYSDHTGYGSANRAFITALHMVEVAVTTQLVQQVAEQTTFGWEWYLAENLRNRNLPYKVKIIHLTPDCYPQYIESAAYNIGHLFWETDKLPQGWADYCNKMQEIWTSSPHMVELFRASGVKVPVYWFPQPIDITLSDKNFGRFTIEGHKGFMFYSIFQWIERKNPFSLVTSYWRAFEGRDDVSLVLKTFRYDYGIREYQKITQDINNWKKAVPQKHYPRLILVKNLLSQEEMMRLHATGDCYVSADRGEGWCRPVHEALLMGKTVVATGRGGIHEFLKDEYYFRIPSSYVQVKSDQFTKFYTPDQRWAQVDEDKLKITMQNVAASPVVANAKGILAKEYVKRTFSYHKVGTMMRDRLAEIYKAL